MGQEIIKPNSPTYWIITDGTNYGDGITGIDQVTTVGNGWAIYWQGIDYDEYIEQCEKINITPEIFRQ